MSLCPTLSPPLYPLALARPGEQVRIGVIPSETPLGARLMALGFLPGEELRIVHGASPRGPLIVEMNACRFTLDADSAFQILVG